MVGIQPTQDEYWTPLQTYRYSLLQGDQGEMGAPTTRGTGRRGRGVKRRVQQEGQLKIYLQLDQILLF